MRRVIVLTAVVLLIALIAVAVRVVSSLSGPHAPVGWETGGADVHGDPLPAGAVARLGTVRFRRTTGTNLEWIDDDHIVSGGFDEEIVVWDAASGDRVRVLSGHRHTIVFPPHRWDWRELRHVLEGGDPPQVDDYLNALRLLSDGRTLVSTGGGIRTWDLSTGAGRFVAYPGGGNVMGFRVLEDEQVLVYTWFEKLRRYDLRDGTALEEIDVMQRPFDLAEVPPDERVPHRSSRDPMQVVRARDGACTVVLHRPEGLSRGAHWLDPAGRFAWCIWVRRRRTTVPAVFDAWLAKVALPSGEEITRHALAPQGWGWGLTAVQEHGLLAVGSPSGHVDVRDLVSGDRMSATAEVGHPALTLTFSPDGRRLVCGGWTAVTVVDTETGAIVAAGAGHGETVESVRWDGGERVVTRDARGARAWDASTGNRLPAPESEPQLAARIETDEAGAAVLGPEGAVLGRVHFTPVQHGAREGTFASVVAFDPSVLRVLLAHEERKALENSSYSTAHSLRFVDATTDTDDWSLPGQDASVAAFFGDLTAVGTDSGWVRLVAGEGTIVANLHAPDSKSRSHYGPFGVMALAFSPDGARLAVGGADHVIRVWSVPDGVLLRTLRGHGGRVTSLAWSSDGSLLVSGSEDTSALVWGVVR